MDVLELFNVLAQEATLELHDVPDIIRIITLYRRRFYRNFIRLVINVGIARHIYIYQVEVARVGNVIQCIPRRNPRFKEYGKGQCTSCKKLV